jgi:hypothetical protein
MLQLLKCLAFNYYFLVKTNNLSACEYKMLRLECLVYRVSQLRFSSLITQLFSSGFL